MQAKEEIVSVLRVVLAAAVLFSLSSFAAAQGSNQPQQKFLLFGTAQDDIDPENPANEVISIVNPTGGASRALRVKIATLDNQIQFKAYYQARSCGGGSPRVTLLIDLNSDNNTDVVAHGHVIPFSGCPPNVWQFQDLTDLLPRWEVTTGFATIPCGPIGGTGTCTWDQLETLVSAFADHQVLAGFLVEDSGSFFPAAAGKAFYDNVTIGNRSIENHEDTARNPR
jgi:hypothetical protein